MSTARIVPHFKNKTDFLVYISSCVSAFLAQEQIPLIDLLKEVGVPQVRIAEQMKTTPDNLSHYLARKKGVNDDQTV